jgi:hypothetical protein
MHDMNLRNGTFWGVDWLCIDFVVVPSFGLKVHMNMSNFGARENPKRKRGRNGKET